MKRPRKWRVAWSRAFFVSVRANIREDDRTSSKAWLPRALTHLEAKAQIQIRGSGASEYHCQSLRHTRKNLEQIRDILKRYPGRSKVNLTIKDSLGHSKFWNWMNGFA